MGRAKMSMARLALLARHLRAVGLAAALSLGLGQAAAAHQAKNILWAYPLIDPFFTEDETGYADRIRKWFIKNLPEFHHSLAPNVALDRSLDLIERQDGVCHSLLFKTEERLKYTVFSAPVMMTPSMLLITPVTHANVWRELVDDQGMLAHDAIFASAFRGAAVTDRSYGPVIDRLIHRLDAGERLVFLDERSAVFGHLIRGWADYSFGYAQESVDPGVGPLTTFPVVGVEPGKLAYFGCSDGPVGRAFLAAVDALIATSGPKPVWLRYYTETLDDNGRAAFDRELKRRAPWGAF